METNEIDKAPLITLRMQPSQLRFLLQLIHTDTTRMQHLIDHARSHGERGRLDLDVACAWTNDLAENLLLAMTIGASFAGGGVESEGSALVDVEELRELREFYQIGAAREAELFDLREFVMDLKTMSPLRLDDSAQQMAYELCAKWGLVDAHTPK